MENLRNEVVKLLEVELGEGYQILPEDKRKNNEYILHGICIHKEGESVSPVIYLEKFIPPYVKGEMDPEEIARAFLKKYHQEMIPQDIAADLKDFGMMKDKVRIKMVNHAANLRELGNSPHRKFLDLAITYYLEITIAGQSASIAITNKLMESWGTTEDDLFRLGMEKLSAEDAGCVTGIFELLRQAMQGEQDELAEKAIAELEERQDGPEMYVASNRKHFFGANCLLNIPLLQELAEGRGCSLIIYPSSVHEIILLPQKDGRENCLDTGDVQEINTSELPRNEWLSNSIYRYDREKKEVSVYKEGAPLLW